MNKDFAPLRPGSKPHLQFTMENQTVSAANSALVAEAYGQFNRIIEAFISRRIADRAEVENLTQDVWMKALTYTQPLCGETLKAFLFTVARNLVNDRLRHHYIAAGVHAEMLSGADIFADDLESAVSAADIARRERQRVECLPPQRRIIYCMTRFDELAIDEIAEKLNLSTRTVENHLRLGRRDVRAYIDAIA